MYIETVYKVDLPFQIEEVWKATKNSQVAMYVDLIKDVFRYGRNNQLNCKLQQSHLLLKESP